jgi:hypothetical protein
LTASPVRLTGVERAPGVKDIARSAKFLQAAQAFDHLTQ